VAVTEARSVVAEAKAVPSGLSELRVGNSGWLQRPGTAHGRGRDRGAPHTMVCEMCLATAVMVSLIETFTCTHSHQPLDLLWSRDSHVTATRFAVVNHSNQPWTMMRELAAACSTVVSSAVALAHAATTLPPRTQCAQ